MRRLSPGDLVGMKGHPVDLISPEVGIVVCLDTYDDEREVPHWKVLFSDGMMSCPETDVILLRGSRA